MEKVIMRKTIITVLFGALLLNAKPLFPQNTEMTPYEQKREKLCAEALEKIMNTMTVQDKAQFSLLLVSVLKSADGDKFQELYNSENLLFAYCGIAETFETEADALTYSSDYSDVYTGIVLQEWKQIGQWYKQKRLELDKTKTAEDEYREAERKKPSIGIAGVKQRVKKDYIKWAKKGEFEKTDAHKKRLSEKGPHIFDSLCLRHFNKMLDMELSRSILGSGYDADREGFDMRFYYGEEDDKKAYVDAFWHMTPEQFKKLTKMTGYANGLFVKDGYFFPAIYHLETENGIAFDISLGEAEYVSLSMAELLGDEYVSDIDHVFVYPSGLISIRELYNMIIDIFNGKKNDYIFYNSEYDFYQRGRRYDEIFPDGKSCYTKEEADAIISIIKEDAEEKENVRLEMARITADYYAVIQEQQSLHESLQQSMSQSMSWPIPINKKKQKTIRMQIDSLEQQRRQIEDDLYNIRMKAYKLGVK
ncbi:MAG: hypothetical protein J1E04_03250 [Alistipes sp.]|nr:hypothetical protein [Alistipes sp.]